MRPYLIAVFWFPLLMWALQSEAFDGWLVWCLACLALGAVVSMFMWPEQRRNSVKFRHVAPGVGEVPVEGTLVAWAVPGRRSTARSALTWAVFLLGITGVASVVAALLAPEVIQVIWIPGGAEFDVAPVGGSWVVAVAILAVALGLGVLGGSLARRRLSRLLDVRPAQPFRVLGPVSVRGKAGVLIGAALIGALAWQEVTGQIVLGLTVVLGALALFLLPAALVALVVTRGKSPGIAGSDVRWIATRGRVPTVDRPAPELRPLTGQDIEAAAGQRDPRPGAAGPARLS